MATAAPTPPGGGGDSHILREYLVALGFRIDEQRQRSFRNTLVDLDKHALRVGASVLGIATAAGYMAHNFARSMERLAYTSQYVDSTVQEMQALEFAGRRAGLSAGTLEQAIVKIATLRINNPGLDNLLESLGVVVQGRSNVNIFTQFMEVMRTADKTTRSQYGNLFGLDPQTMQYVLENWPKFTADMAHYNQMVKESGVDSKALADATKEYGQIVEDLTAKLRILGQVLVWNALPFLREFHTFVGTGLDKWNKLLGAGEKWRDALKDIASKDPTVQKTEEATKNFPARPAPLLTDEEEEKRYGWMLKVLPESTRKLWRAWRDRQTREGTAGTSARDRALGIVDDDPSVKGVDDFGNDKAGYLRELEQRYGLRPGILDAVWNRESRRSNPKFMGPSSAGALGPFQFQEATGKQYGVTDRMDFNQSALGAAKYLADLHKMFGGDTVSALAAWNMGPGAFTRRGLGNLPRETQGFVAETAGALNINTEIHIHGVTDPVQAGNVVTQRQGRIATDAARELRGKVR